MKRLLLSLFALLIFAAVAMGDEVRNAQTIQILKSPMFSKDEMKQMLFSASFLEGYAPGTIGYALYNPSRDKSIRGIVINIFRKDANTGQEHSVDLFIDVDCGPLQGVNNQESCAALATLSTGSSVLTLKEAHYLKPDEAETPASVAASKPAVEHTTPVVIQLHSDGTTEMAGAAMTLSELPTKFKDLAASPEKPAIIVKADQNVPYDQVIKILDLCRDAGLNRVSFAITMPAKGEK